MFKRFQDIAHGAVLCFRLAPAQQAGYRTRHAVHDATLPGQSWILSKAKFLDHGTSNTLGLYDSDLTFHDRRGRRSVSRVPSRVYDEFRLCGKLGYCGDEVEH